MPFGAGDVVVHPIHGVGRIARIVERQFSGGELRRYYEIVTQTGTVWVPVDGDEGLRPVTPKAHLGRYRHLLKSRPAALNRRPDLRHRELAERLKVGTFAALCEVVRDLTALGWRKMPNELDAKMLREARERLGKEWADAQEMTVEEALREIDVLLREAREAYKP